MSPLPGSGVVHAELVDRVSGVAASTRPDSGQLRAPQRINGASGQTVTWVDVGDPVDVRVSSTATLRGTERLVAEQVQGSKLAVIAGPSDWPVEAKHRIVVNGTRTFEVVEILGPQSYQPELRVVATEVGL
jgi:hypothetical protein